MADKLAPILAPAPARRRHPHVRFFEKPEVTLYRMGRLVSTFTGEHGVLDLRTGSVHLHAATATGTDLTVTAKRIALNLSTNQVIADGSVHMEEAGISMTSDRVIAPPSLIGHAASGRVTLLAKDRESAAALMTTRLL